MRYLILAGILTIGIAAAIANDGATGDQPQFPSNYVPSGQVLYKQFCAACHGADAKGSGPAAATLKTPPPDLTLLAKHNLGKFPSDYVSMILQFGPGPSAHGSSDMPTWGPIFQLLDKSNERAVQHRIKNLSDYLNSIQEH